ncbi:MAG: electron transport complex subunit RsxE [Gammaproteobacteria bacterium]|nr:electron transport complex subunit RsxE [Gammaproteobacteria bacterium]
MYRDALIDGLWRRNVASVQLLGLCPLLAVSYNVRNALGLSIASSFVLIGSSLTISSVRKFIPDNVRLPCFVLVIATLTTVATMYMQAFAYDLYVQVALFVQIIVTNCMILGHIESIASKKTVSESLFSAIGTALGFSAALLVLGTIRQYLELAIPLAAHPAGAFLVVGLALATLNTVSEQITKKIPALRKT